MELQEPTELLPKLQKPRGIYLLPNLFTTAALFAAFYAIIAAVKGNFDVAAVAVFIAMIADTLDGRVARMTNTQTAFGAEYDSLSDMVGFGVAPAVIAYTWSLTNLGKLGWLAAFLYTAATALRLARFNTQAHDQDKQYFQGLPCPSAAAVISGAVWLGYSNEIVDGGLFVAIPLAALVIFIAALMVSTIRYHSFKKFDLRGKIPFIMVIIVVLIISTIALDPPEILFSGFFLYALSGPVMTLWQLRKMRKAGKRFKSQS
ncbi:MAG: CDP-diacylglycerol--serine O-phosphatidyltransferase [Pseudomonadota bacterium]